MLKCEACGHVEDRHKHYAQSEEWDGEEHWECRVQGCDCAVNWSQHSFVEAGEISFTDYAKRLGYAQPMYLPQEYKTLIEKARKLTYEEVNKHLEEAEKFTYDVAFKDGINHVTMGEEWVTENRAVSRENIAFMNGVGETQAAVDLAQQELLKRLLKESWSVTILPMLRENQPYDRQVVFADTIIALAKELKGKQQ